MKTPAAPAYFINLDRHPERREATAAQLRAVGIRHTRISGIDYRDLDGETIRRAVDPAPPLPFKRVLSPGEVACFLSHLKVWRLIADGTDELAFVFEDDVSFTAGASDALVAIEEGPRDWDMVRLFCPRPVRSEDVRTLHGRFRTVLSRKYPMSTIAYAVTRQAAARLAATMVPFGQPVDMALKCWWVHGLCTRIVVPSACEPRTDPFSASTLDSNRETHSRTGPVARFAANLRYQFAIARMRRLHAGDFPRRSRLQR
ncbi:glycosyltransferase family 25 protein [Aquibium microcysteis]|uniref:glycosyltransferase family 25 protein n=1 Tax=Aquibium microcysteis TaxID=675281 RepID=UPI00165D07A5|nr:glycosyltransferase family 25 protein [Aquibium microcysteis]